MGTRHLICIYYNGHFVVAQYGQWDGYPAGQGVQILNFLNIPGKIQLLKQGLQYIKEAESDEEIGETVPSSLSRDTTAKILEMIAQATEDSVLPIVKDLKFVNDTLFCEWAYVIDLEEGALEVFQGMNGASHKGEQARSDRFQDVGAANAKVPILVESFSLDALPKNEGELLVAVEYQQKALGLKDDEGEHGDE